METTQIIRSKISFKGALLGVLLLLFIGFLGWGMYWIFRNNLQNGGTWGVDFILPFMVFVLLFGLSLLVLVYANFYAVIDKSQRILIHYSLRYPHGKVLALQSYIGYFTVLRTSRVITDSQYYRTQATVLYLVDSEHNVRYGLNKLFYRNFDEMTEALGLPRIYSYLLEPGMAFRSSLGLGYKIKNVRFESVVAGRKKS